MDGFFEEIGKGFFRGIGYILADIFFGIICYWVGWPVCKLITLGNYPSVPKTSYFDQHRRSRNDGVWCSLLGFIILLLVALYLLGQF